MPLYTFIHNLLNVLVQIANKMGLQKNVSRILTSLDSNPMNSSLLSVSRGTGSQLSRLQDIGMPVGPICSVGHTSPYVPVVLQSLSPYVTVTVTIDQANGRRRVNTLSRGEWRLAGFGLVIGFIEFM
jgi:hypothetical protein